MSTKTGLTSEERSVIDNLATEVVERRNSFPFRQLVESLKPELAKAAHQVFRSYLIQASKKSDQSSLAWSHLGIGMVFSGRRQYEAALKHLDKANQIFSLTGEDLGLACVFREMSYSHRELDRNSLSLEYAHKAVIIFDSLKRKLELGWMYDNMSVIFFSKGELVLAEQLNRQAIRQFSPLNNRDGVAWGLFQLARVQRSRGQFLKAWQSAKGALDRYEHIANQKGMGWAELELAIICLGLGDLAHARESLIRAKVKGEQLDIIPLKAAVEVALAQLYMDQGMLQKAFEGLNEVDIICAKISSREINIEALLARARYSVIINDLPLLKKTIDKIDQLIVRHQLSRYINQVNLVRAEAAVLSKKYAEALKLFKETGAAAEKLEDRSVSVGARLGQLQLSGGQTAAQLLSLEKAIENELRFLNSRLIKAKFCLVKAMVSKNGIGKNIKQPMVHQGLKVLGDSNFLVVNLQALNMLQECCSKNQLGMESEGYRQSKEALLGGGVVDLQMVHPRSEFSSVFPVSVIS